MRLPRASTSEKVCRVRMGWLSAVHSVYLQAIQEIHNPSSHEDLEEAKRRLAFEELLLLQLTLLLRRELCRQGVNVNMWDVLGKEEDVECRFEGHSLVS